jgi:flagellar biosynthesis/type III secretory pathway protein FliH
MEIRETQRVIERGTERGKEEGLEGVTERGREEGDICGVREGGNNFHFQYIHEYITFRL